MQLVKKRLGLLQIERVEAFGEPAIDRGEKSAGLILLALVAQPQQKGFLFDDLVSAQLELQRHVEAERLGCL
jgi:hypothetical protein